MPNLIRKMGERSWPPAPALRPLHPWKRHLKCPICGYRGPFADFGHFEKYRAVFSRVGAFGSDDFPEISQPFVYEDRARWPTAGCPLRTPTPGARHPDYVPVCYA